MSAKHPRILLVEDDDTRAAHAKILRREHREVVECANSVDMLCELRHYFVPGAVGKDFDLIISDIRMPGVVSATVVLDGLRQCGRCPPIILMTAFNDQKTHERAKLLGAISILDKPFDTDELLATVHEALKSAPGGRKHRCNSLQHSAGLCRF